MRHVFTMLGGITKSPDSFSGTIRKSLSGDVSSWSVVANFNSIPNLNFIKLPESVITNFSGDQHYAYKNCKICSVIIKVDSDRRYLKIGLIAHSRWVTFGCGILRYYISVDERSSMLATFGLQVRFKFKANSQFTCGSRNLFNIVQRILQISNKTVGETALKVVNKMDFFAHPENF